MSFFSNIFGRSKDVDTDSGQQTGVSEEDGGGGSESTTESSDESQAKGGDDNAGTQQQGGAMQMDEATGDHVPAVPEGAIASDGNLEGGTWHLDEATGELTNKPAESPTTVVTDQSQAQGGVNNAGTAPEGAIASDGQLEGATLQLNQQTGELANAPTYLADWGSGVTFGDAIKGSDHSIADMMADYNKWAGANGQEPLDIFTMMNAVQNRDVNKSVEQNEKDAKKAARQERWQQAANILHHLGNFVGTLYGAPPQTVESMTDLTARQQKIRLATEQQRAAYNQNLLAQIWKDRADQRAAEKNKADIGLIQQRVQGLQADEERKNAKNQADIALAGARQQQAEQAAGLSQERAETERAMRNPKIANMKASTNAHNASATASRARAAASNSQAYGNNYKANRYKIWAENKRKHPNDVKTFMEQNNIHSWDRKNWSAELIDQFNAWIADKHSGNGGSGSGGAADLLD